MPRQLPFHGAFPERDGECEPLGRIQVEEVLQALHAGEIIEEYPEDQPYPSCLIVGRTLTGRALHIVGALVPEESRFFIITTYQPDQDRWEMDFRRRRRS